MEVPTRALWGKQKDGDLQVEVCICHEQGKMPMTTAITPGRAGCPEGQQPVNPTGPVGLSDFTPPEKALNVRNQSHLPGSQPV